MPKYDDSLRGYGYETHMRDNFVCQYCGYDGRSFPNWLQLTIDHVLPRSLGGEDNKENLVTACQFCNSATSRMEKEIDRNMSIEEIKKMKKERVNERIKDYFQFWEQSVAPQCIDKI